MKDIAHNAEYIKRLNRQHIMELLRRSPMSRIQLARETGLTRAAITLIARELLEDGLLLEGEVSVRTKKGKAPIPLSINPSAYYAIGIYLNRQEYRIGVTDFAGNVLTQRSIEMDAEHNLEILKAQVQELMTVCPRERIMGIGISTPGPVNAERGIILNPPYFEDWQNTAIAPYLSAALGIPAYLEKDASTLAMYHLAYEQSKDFLLLLVETGVGSGVISGGRLLTSRDHYTPELGHTSIRMDGKKCECGNYGCLESYASIPNLLADHGNRYASWQEVIDAGDEELLETEVKYLSTAIVNLRNLVNFDTIYLSGDVLYGFDQISARLMRRIAKYSMIKSPIQILPSRSIPEIGVAAAANLVFTKHFEP